jgi:L-arabinose isomerase
VFSAEPGIATTAALVPLEGELYRLVVGHGEVLDTPELPNVEMHYFHFRPERGMEAFMDEWLRLGAPHHFVTNLGDHCPRWRRFAELLDLEYEEI